MILKFNEFLFEKKKSEKKKKKATKNKVNKNVNNYGLSNIINNYDINQASSPVTGDINNDQDETSDAGDSGD